MKSLLSLRPGQKGRITSLESTGKTELQKFLSFGLLPGTIVEVVQVSPAYVLQVGFTQLALDRQTAGRIIVD